MLKIFPKSVRFVYLLDAEREVNVIRIITHWMLLQECTDHFAQKAEMKLAQVGRNICILKHAY